MLKVQTEYYVFCSAASKLQITVPVSNRYRQFGNCLSIVCRVLTSQYLSDVYVSLFLGSGY